MSHCVLAFLLFFGGLFPGRLFLPLVQAPTRSASCDAAYPTVCIPSPPPDLDCGDIPYRDFPVLPPDPHHFDRDRNGIGCELGAR